MSPRAKKKKGEIVIKKKIEQAISKNIPPTRRLHTSQTPLCKITQLSFFTYTRQGLDLIWKSKHFLTFEKKNKNVS